MVLGSKVDGGSQIISFRIKNTIQSIKEVVGDASEAEIYAMLKDSNMDPNETAQKLLNQDPFHEVKRKRDKKKEHAAHRGFVDSRKPTEQNIQWAKPSTSWDRNARKGGYTRNSVPGISREFRIVRDNRVNQNANCDAKPETCQHPASGSQQVLFDIPEMSSAGILTGQKHSAARNPDGHVVSQVVNGAHDSGPGCSKDGGLSGSLPPEELPATASVSTSQVQKEVQNKSRTYSSLASTNSVIGVYSSSSDPVHVPSPDSRSAGNVGAIRREVGVVGVPKQSSDASTTHSSVSNSSSSFPSPRKDISPSAESLGHSVAMSKSNQPNQTSASERNMPSMSISRSFSSSQYNNKLHQQSMGHQKAMQPNMEWKPKPSQKSTIVSPGMTSAPSSSYADNSSSSSPVDGTGLSEKLAHVNIMENQHVIIPQHLRVPESERTRLMFGSFGVGFDSTKGSTSALQATELNDEPSVSVSASIPRSSSEVDSAADPGDLEDCQARTSRSDSPASAVESDQPPTGNNESLSPDNIESYEEIGLVQSHSPPYSAPEPQLQDPPRLSSFSQAYDSQTSYDVPFFRTVMEDSVRGQGLASPTEAFSSHITNSNTPSTVALAQQLPVQQQQLPVAQLYPQVQISHFPNYVPYRHIFSPVYASPMAIPNYPSSPSYPHPSNGSNYLLMPGASSHLTAGGVKYAASQYKPVPAGTPTGYGSYTNPAGFTISAPTSIGGVTSLEDVTRIKYKDNNLYVPNPQAESSDIWIQTQRELPGLQSAPYYNLSGQAPHAAFMPQAHAGHPSFNAAAAAAAAQTSHLQYPTGLYHPQQAASVPNSHHLVHQQVPQGFGGGVGVAAPGPQVGAYQQSQVSHLNWNNF